MSAQALLDASGDRPDHASVSAWAITRRDGVTLGFTDHDRPLTFDGMTFRADTGLTARALAADHRACRSTIPRRWARCPTRAITEADIEAGRYDGAEVTRLAGQLGRPGAAHGAVSRHDRRDHARGRARSTPSCAG